MSRLKLEAFAVTHEGKVRSNNEDNYNLFGTFKTDASKNRKSVSKSTALGQAVAAVVDGMGGESNGETAALITTKCFKKCRITNVEEEAKAQINKANKAVCDMMDSKKIRMGAACAQLYFDGDRAVCVNLGDCRGYLFRDRYLFPLSHDHSEGQQMIDMGVTDDERSRKSSAWHKLTQHIGVRPEDFLIEPYFSEEVWVLPRDLYLLCSDGLTDMLNDEFLEDILSETVYNQKITGCEQIAEKLLELALNRGGKDNITLVLISVVDTEKKGRTL